MYRYSAKKYNDALLSMGSIRVGTLHDFRRIEHKRGIADPQEGKKEVCHHIDHAFLDGGDSIHERAAEEFRAIKGSVECRNVVFSRSFDEPDCFVLCASETCSKQVMREFEGAETCVEIFNQQLFFNLLTQALNSIVPVIYRGVHRVIYQDRREAWNGKDWGYHPALIKETKFASQDEIRAIWQPKSSKPIEPINLCSYRLVAACRQVRI